MRLGGGAFLMGSKAADAKPEDGEGPVCEEYVEPFLIDPKTVSNAAFAAFAAASGYETDSERIGWSFVFKGLFDGAKPDRLGTSAGAPWWLAVKGASWRRPLGPGSGIGAIQNHPVVHISWRDANAYCAWARVRLPTEIEWEYAARGGLEQKTYPWGDELMPGGRHACNIWQGVFPNHNTLGDGYFGTAPCNAFRSNGYGLYNVVGNVWEWCSDAWSVPRVPLSPQSSSDDPRVLRGGSYLCHDSYCNRYRVAARTQNTPNSSSGNTGFRVAADASVDS